MIIQNAFHEAVVQDVEIKKEQKELIAKTCDNVLDYCKNKQGEYNKRQYASRFPEHRDQVHNSLKKELVKKDEEVTCNSPSGSQSMSQEIGYKEFHALYRVPKARKHNPFNGDAMIKVSPKAIAMIDDITKKTIYQTNNVNGFDFDSFVNGAIVTFGDYQIQFDE